MQNTFVDSVGNESSCAESPLNKSTPNSVQNVVLSVGRTAGPPLTFWSTATCVLLAKGEPPANSVENPTLTPGA
eukprot:5740145-Pyramimonas_sp.AAC.1